MFESPGVASEIDKHKSEPRELDDHDVRKKAGDEEPDQCGL
jgi:hypothetical protein